LKKIGKVEAQYEKLHADYESVSEHLQKVEEKEIEEAVWSIRDTKAKGKPMKDMFVGHCRTLLATGASARSVREQLYLNAKFFLSPQLYSDFNEEMPSLHTLVPISTRRHGLREYGLQFYTHSKM